MVFKRASKFEMKKFTFFKAATVICVLATGGFAFAHSGAEGVVKQRMDMMGKIGDSMKEIGAMLRNGGYDPNTVERAALVIQNHAALLPPLFPEGSADGPSEALPTIWDNWNEFTDLVGEMGFEARQLTTLVRDGTAFGGVDLQFQQLARTCKSCHEKFRLKK